jgi:hypothetical protein
VVNGLRRGGDGGSAGAAHVGSTDPRWGWFDRGSDQLVSRCGDCINGGRTVPWSIEGLFLRLTTVLKCEVNTWGYPPAALFGFCVALAVGNVYAGVKGALRAAHGTELVEGVSDYHLALEVSGTCPGLWIAVASQTWSVIGAWSVADMARWLLGLADGANLRRYRKATRGPKKPKPSHTRFPEAKHVATSRLLDSEQT